MLGGLKFVIGKGISWEGRVSLGGRRGKGWWYERVVGIARSRLSRDWVVHNKYN